MSPLHEGIRVSTAYACSSISIRTHLPRSASGRAGFSLELGIVMEGAALGVRAAPAICLTTADAAVRLREQPALEPPPRCRADNPRRPAGSGRSYMLPRGPC